MSPRYICIPYNIFPRAFQTIKPTAPSVRSATTPSILIGGAGEGPFVIAILTIDKDGLTNYIILFWDQLHKN